MSAACGHQESIFVSLRWLHWNTAHSGLLGCPQNKPKHEQVGRGTFVVKGRREAGRRATLCRCTWEVGVITTELYECVLSKKKTKKTPFNDSKSYPPKWQSVTLKLNDCAAHPDTSSCPSEEYAQERTGADWPVRECRSSILQASGEKHGAVGTLL